MPVADAGRVLRNLTFVLALFAAPAALAQTPINGFAIDRLSVGGDTLTTDAEGDYVVGFAACHEFLGLGDLPSACPGGGGTTSDVVTTDATTTGDAGTTPAGNVQELTIEISTGEQSSSEISVGVGTCSETDLEETTSCELVQKPVAISTLSALDFTFEVNKLIGDTCAEGRSDTVSIYFQVDDGLTLRNNRVDLELRYDRPDSPQLESAVEGEGNIKLDWSTSDSEKYKVYYGTRPFTTATLGSDIQSDSFTGQSEGQIDGLENGVTYYFGVVAVDDFDNESEICSESELLSTAPVPVDDFFEYYKRNGGAEEGGFSVCFVATAAWESPLAPAVTWLRQYRDTRMLTNDGGRALVELYYTVGPHAARVVAEHGWLKVVARVLLLPLVLCSLLFVAWPAWGPVLGGLMAWAGYRRAQRRKAEGPTT